MQMKRRSSTEATRSSSSSSDVTDPNDSDQLNVRPISNATINNDDNRNMQQQQQQATSCGLPSPGSPSVGSAWPAPGMRPGQQLAFFQPFEEDPTSEYVAEAIFSSPSGGPVLQDCISSDDPSGCSSSFVNSSPMNITPHINLDHDRQQQLWSPDPRLLQSPPPPSSASNTILAYHSNMSKLISMAGFEQQQQLPPQIIAQEETTPPTKRNHILPPPAINVSEVSDNCTGVKRPKLSNADLPPNCPSPLVNQSSLTKSTAHAAGSGSSGGARGSKEKLSERISALQQLVSPFGRTDTASVLREAHGYIKFLQDQVQVLSSPYLKPVLNRQVPTRANTDPASGSDEGSGAITDLRSRGLCLVPVSCTLHVANNINGADYWASASTRSIHGGGSSHNYPST